MEDEILGSHVIIENVDPKDAVKEVGDKVPFSVVKTEIVNNDRIIDKFVNGETLKGREMPPPFMNVVTGAFVTSWVFLHILSILVVESWVGTNNSIALRCLFVYLILLGLISLVGWFFHKLELVQFPSPVRKY